MVAVVPLANLLRQGGDLGLRVIAWARECPAISGEKLSKKTSSRRIGDIIMSILALKGRPAYAIPAGIKKPRSREAFYPMFLLT